MNPVFARIVMIISCHRAGHGLLYSKWKYQIAFCFISSIGEDNEMKGVQLMA